MLIDTKFDIHLSERHYALKDYSKEHREILLFARKIRETLFDDVDTNRIISKCKSFYREFLSHHITREEKFIFSKLPAHSQDLIKPRKDHIKIERRIINLLTLPDHIWQLRLFVWELEAHVLYQEKKLFNSLEHKFPEEILLSMKDPEGKIEYNIDWNHPFS